jgi:hypothetical protein
MLDAGVGRIAESSPDDIDWTPMTTTLAGGTFTLAENLTMTRMGYGAMQLAGPHVFGPPTDRDEAIRVLREVVELGITHIDTSDYYGPSRRWTGERDGRLPRRTFQRSRATPAGRTDQTLGGEHGVGRTGR